MSLGNLEMLTDVDITFTEGRIYGLVGRNGIGKVKKKRERNMNNKTEKEIKNH